MVTGERLFWHSGGLLGGVWKVGSGAVVCRRWLVLAPEGQRATAHLFPWLSVTLVA